MNALEHQCLHILDQHINMRSRLIGFLFDVPGFATPHAQTLSGKFAKLSSKHYLAMRIRFDISRRTVPLPLVGVVSDAIHVQEVTRAPPPREVVNFLHINISMFPDQFQLDLTSS